MNTELEKGASYSYIGTEHNIQEDIYRKTLPKSTLMNIISAKCMFCFVCVLRKHISSEIISEK